MIPIKEFRDDTCQVNRNPAGAVLVKGKVSIQTSELKSVQITGCTKNPVRLCRAVGLKHKGVNQCGILRSPRNICWLPKCSKCPKVGGVTAFMKTETGTNYKQSCQYPLAAFKTAADINTFATLESSAEDIRTKVMPEFCKQTSTDCSNGEATCSRFLDLSADGAKCRTWALANPEQAQVPKAEYCLANPNTPECACFSRIHDPMYKFLKQGNPFVDSCWYEKCSGQDGMPHLIPSDLMNPVCPENYCGILVQLYENTDISLEDLNFNLTCDFVLKPDPQPLPDPQPQPEKPAGSNAKFIIGIVGVVVLLLLILGLVFVG